MQFEIFPVTRFKQNCSIVWCEKTNRAAVIDPGGEIPDILNFLEVMDLEPEVALVTHGHFDHCGAAAQFAEATGARIEGPHRADAPLVGNLATQATYLATFAKSRMREDGEHSSELLELLSHQSRMTFRNYTPDRWLEDGDRVQFGAEELTVLHCPGHTEGHVAYFSETNRQAFVGDILFRRAIGAWEHPGGSLPQLMNSIRRKLFVLGDDVSFVPGHGPTSTFGAERQDNPFVGDAAFDRWCARFPENAAS